jgi:protein Mpv17
MYSHALKTEPMQTKVITGIFLAIGGDAIAQAREPHLYDAKRAYSFAAFDGCYRAIQQITYPPLMEYCQGQFLLGLMGTLGMTTSENTVPLLAAFEQTLVSQLVIIPTLYYPFFYAITGTVQGLTIKQTIVRAQETFIPLMKRNLLFWIPVQFAVFGFVEESLQIPILIVCGLVWTVILSVVAGSVKVQEEEDIGGLALQEEAYCVTGMEGGCLIDPDDLFHAPKVLQSADEGMLLDGSIGSAESLVVTIEPRETAGEGESLTIEPLLQARGSETVKTGANQTEDVLN